MQRLQRSHKESIMKAIRVVSTVMLLALSGTPTPGGSASLSEEPSTGGATRGASSILEDAALTARIKTVLTAAGAASVQVATTQGGVVQLSGFVDNPADAERAVEVARQVKGVREVYNDIRVVPDS
jgi:hyperosmotically inducible periplasmic protein